MRILLAEPPGVLRDSIRGLLDWELSRTATPVLDQAATLEQACSLAERWRPDIALVSADLPPDGGIRALEQLHAIAPSCRLIMLARAHDQVELMRAIRAGATGFVARCDPAADLLAAIAAAAARRASVPSGMLEGILLRAAGLTVRPDSPSALVERLTARERQVLAALASGQGNRRLGERLGISPHTARTHVQNLLPKLGVHSRLEAAAIARQSGMLGPATGGIAS